MAPVVEPKEKQRCSQKDPQELLYPQLISATIIFLSFTTNPFFGVPASEKSPSSKSANKLLIEAKRNANLMQRKVDLIQTQKLDPTGTDWKPPRKIPVLSEPLMKGGSRDIEEEKIPPSYQFRALIRKNASLQVRTMSGGGWRRVMLTWEGSRRISARTVARSRSRWCSYASLACFKCSSMYM